MGLERITYTGNVAARLLGPGAVVIGQDTYQSDLTKTYIQFTLLNSFPTVNKNGMTFTPPLLARAIPTANDQPLNVDHQLEGNPEEVYSGTDQIIGTMLKSYLATVGGDLELLPASSMPVKVIGVLWNRTSLAQTVINSIGEEEKEYRVSFEVVRDVSEDGWIVYGADGPSYETEIAEELFESWKKGSFDKVALAVGGDGSGNSTNFWGGAFTLTPADESAEIDNVLTGSFDAKYQCAIASTGKKHKYDNDKKKKPALAPKKKGYKPKQGDIPMGFIVTVDGNKLGLTLAGQDINQPDDFYLSGYKLGDGTYAVHASLMVHQPGIDGFKEKVRYEYDPDNTDAATAMAPVKDGEEKVITAAMYEARLTALKATIKTEGDVRQEFEGWLSPADVKTKQDEAVAAALAEAGHENLITPEQLNDQVQQAVKDALDARSAAEAAAVLRGKQLQTEGFVLTDERVARVATFVIGDDGDKKFAAWMVELKADQVDMLKAIEAAGVEVNDQIKAALAHVNNKNEAGFAAVVAAHGKTAPQSQFAPSLPLGGDGVEQPQTVVL